MSVIETGLALQWLTSTLLNDATLTSLAPGSVWRGLAPTSVTTYPFCVYNFQAGSDLLTFNVTRIWSSQLFQVRCVGPASNTAGIMNAASRVDALLGRTSGTPTGGIIYAAYRESPLLLEELVNGVLFSSIGGLYRLLVQQA
jgi:hypothetical protein